MAKMIKPKSKGLPPAGKQTPADFYPESYDKKFPAVKGGGANYNGPSVGPREKDPKGMSKNGSKIKKAKNGGSFPDLNKDGKITKADILKGRGVIAKKGAKIKKK